MLTTWLLDFDNTAFNTSTRPPLGITVEEAYALAVHEVLGAHAVTRYLEGGGLRNRAPSEVIRELLPNATADEVMVWSEALVQAKLSRLVKQIGLSGWPLPCQGFVSFWQKLTGYAEASLVRTGIISSGHQGFIERVWRMHDLQLPNVMVTDDDLRNRRQPELARRVKPGTFPLALARQRLSALTEGTDRAAAQDKSGIVYIGDDPVKDGEMARRAGVQFGLFVPDGLPGLKPWGFRFSDWRWVEDRLPRFVGANI